MRSKLILSLLVFFVTGFGILFWATHSSFFKSLVVRQLSFYLHHRHHITLAITDFDFTLIPPGISATAIQVDRKDKNPFEFNATNIHLTLQPFQLFTNTLTLSKLSINDAQLTMDIPSNNKPPNIRFNVLSIQSGGIQHFLIKLRDQKTNRLIASELEQITFSRATRHFGLQSNPRIQLAGRKTVVQSNQTNIPIEFFECDLFTYKDKIEIKACNVRDSKNHATISGTYHRDGKLNLISTGTLTLNSLPGISSPELSHTSGVVNFNTHISGSTETPIVSLSANIPYLILNQCHCVDGLN